MRPAILCLMVVIQGCSYATVVTHKDRPKACTSHYTAPVIDTGLTLWGTLGVAAIPLALSRASLSNSRGSADAELFLLFGAMIAAPIVGGMSAYHGYSEVGKCRDHLAGKDEPK